MLFPCAVDWQGKGVSFEIYSEKRDLISSSSFVIHCESRDDDLGGHIVVQGSLYSFKFSPSVWGTTLFHCAVEREGKGLSFEMYNENRDLIGRCEKICLWKVRPDGVAGFAEHWDNPDLYFPWTR
ncbi:S-protein homolog 5-like [Punica granatum]|uniref:S-protein homolog n=1 Tax=Punica granatum TaxID=22663 RepID=A0A6P8BT72_PUNGR|nr:S-protein homolog 5-like [Punica granatum]